MKRPLAACRYVCGSLAAITAVTSALPVTAAANTSSANFDMRRQVVNLTGILNVTDYTGQVTRGDFARMLVNASSYRENLPSSSVSVFADVPGTHPDAVYIRIAASQGWMTGFLGGLFKPEEYITYKDAVKAALTMLGYSDEDFTGDLASSRISKFNYLELNEEMNRQREEQADEPADIGFRDGQDVAVQELLQIPGHGVVPADHGEAESHDRREEYADDRIRGEGTVPLYGHDAEPDEDAENRHGDMRVDGKDQAERHAREG